MSSFTFTKLHKLESIETSKMNPDDQIVYMVSMLKGAIKNWQVLAPTPKKRIIYFELEDGNVKLETVSGYQENLRKFALGEKNIGVTNGKNRRKRN